MKYRRKGEAESRGYVLNPLGLIQRGPVSYLLASVAGYDEPRSFVLHRFQRANMLEDPATRPKGFDLPSYLSTTGALDFGAGKVIRLDAVLTGPRPTICKRRL